MRKNNQNMYMKKKERRTTNNMSDKSDHLEYPFDDGNKAS